MTTRTLKTVALALAVCLCGISQLAAKDISQMLEDNMDGGGYDGLLDRYPDGTSQNTMDDLETLKTSILSRLNEGTPLYKELESQANAPDEPADPWQEPEQGYGSDQRDRQIKIFNSGNVQLDYPFSGGEVGKSKNSEPYEIDRTPYFKDMFSSYLRSRQSRENSGKVDDENSRGYEPRTDVGYVLSKRNPFCVTRKCKGKRTIANFNGPQLVPDARDNMLARKMGLTSYYQAPSGRNIPGFKESSHDFERRSAGSVKEIAFGCDISGYCIGKTITRKGTKGKRTASNQQVMLKLVYGSDRIWRGTKTVITENQSSCSAKGSNSIPYPPPETDAGCTTGSVKTAVLDVGQFVLSWKCKEPKQRVTPCLANLNNGYVNIERPVPVPCDKERLPENVTEVLRLEFNCRGQNPCKGIKYEEPVGKRNLQCGYGNCR